MAPALALLALLLPQSAPSALPRSAPSAPPAAPPEVAVRLAREADPPALRIEVELAGDADGETAFAVAESWGGVPPGRTDLVELAARGPGGAALPVAGAGPHRWRVGHPPGARVVVTARVRPNAFRGSFDGQDRYRPLVEPGLVHAIGHLALPLPEEADWDAERSVEVSLAGLVADGGSAACSFGAGPGPHRVRASLAELRGALFVAGDLDLHVRDVRGGPLAVAVERGVFPFETAALADLAARIVDLERELVGEDEASPYLVSAVAVGPPAGRGTSFGGTGLHRAFALFLAPDTEVALDAPAGLELRKLLAHECFHEWNGVRLRLAEPEEALYWWSEGLTDFAAREVLRAAGWLDDAAYAEAVSRTLAEYARNPWRDRSAADVATRFWSDRDAQRLPYVRGDVAALWLEGVLRERSGGEAGVVALVADLAREAAGRPLGEEELLAAVAARAGDEAAARLRATVVEGAVLELPPDALGERFEVVPRTLHAFAPGLDLDASLAEGRVVGLVPGSPAAAAGLVEGAEVVGWSVWRGDPDREVEAVLREPDGERRVRWLPRGPELAGQAVRVR